MKYFPACLAALLVILLSACRSALISDLLAQPGEKLFRDDFSDSSGSWPQLSDPNGSLGIANGVYRIQVNTANYELLAAPGHTFRNVQIEVDVARLAGPVQNMFGLACRSSNLKNFYFFAVSSDGYYALGKIVSGKTILLGQEMMAPSAAIVQGPGPNHLRLDCIGETLRGYINDQVIATSNDTGFPSGDVGLIARALDTPGVDVAFDNFVVYKP